MMHDWRSYNPRTYSSGGSDGGSDLRHLRQQQQQQQQQHVEPDSADVFQVRESPAKLPSSHERHGAAFQHSREQSGDVGGLRRYNETFYQDDVFHAIYNDFNKSNNNKTRSRSAISTTQDLGSYDGNIGNSTELGYAFSQDSLSGGNHPDRFRYPHYEAVPFNTDESSNSAHFDVEFFPEPFNSSYFPLNETDSGHSATDSSLLYSPWGSSPSSGGLLNHFNSSLSPFHFNTYLLNNVTSLGFDHSHVTKSDYYDHFLVQSNSSSSYNDSSASSHAGSAGDLYTWSILMMAPLVIFGVAGNTLVILAISLEKRLQNVTNYFLLSLAVTDLLVSLIVMPLSIINVFTGRWLFGLLLCDFFVTSDVLMCTSSILHLCTISLERYIGIRYPLWTKNKSKRIVLLKIVLVWTIALAITSPITVLGVVRSDNILWDGKCNLTNEPFLIYGSIFAFFIPLVIMILMYGLTVNMLNNQARLGLRRGPDDGEGQPMIRRSTSRRNWQTRRKFYGRELLSVPATRGESDYESGNGLACPVIHQRFGPVNVSRNNTIPLCHHQHHHHHHHHHSHHSHYHYDNRLDPAAGGVVVVGANVIGSNSSINSLHNNRGRSGSSNINAAGANNNNNINNGGSGGVVGGMGGGCTADANSVALNNVLNLRRGRYSTQNGRGGPGYASARGSPPEYQYCNGHQEETPSEMTSESRNCCSSILSSSSSSSSPTSSSNREPKRLRELVRKHHVAVKAANILLMKRDGQSLIPGPSLTPPSSSAYASVRRDNSVRTEQKASKVLGVVFMIFVVCWAPFFTVNILTPLCSTCTFEPTLVTAFVWLGYVSSTLNPIIYTIFNNIFRITFIKLLCCRYRLLHRARRTSNLPGMRNGMLGCSTYVPGPVSLGLPSTTPNTTMIEESNC